MGARDYLAGRTGAPVSTKADLVKLLPQLTAMRLTAMQLLDEAHGHQGEEPDAQLARNMEETIQTLGALVRELDGALQGLRKVPRILDQLVDVEARLALAVDPLPKPEEPELRPPPPGRLADPAENT